MIQLLIDFGGLTTMGVMHAAAICIQSFYRGCKTRKWFEEKFAFVKQHNNLPKTRVPVLSGDEKLKREIFACFQTKSLDSLISDVCNQPKQASSLRNQYSRCYANSKLDKVKIIQRW